MGENSRRRDLGAVLVAVSLALAPPGAAEEPRALRIAGSTTLLPAVGDWVEEFRQLYPELDVALDAGGTTAGLAALAAGRIDVALASRAARPEELGRAAAAGVTLERVTVARDALAVIVHPDNPLISLTRDELRAIFSGEVRDWGALDAPPGPITVVARNPESHSAAFFRRHILEDRDFATDRVEAPDRQQMVARVASDPGAIGFTGLGDAFASRDRRRVAVLLLELEGAGGGLPTYALSRPLYFYFARPPSPAVRRFIDFVTSDAGQELLVRGNFLPLPIDD